MSFYQHKAPKQPKVVTYGEALQKMANYCAYQERCHKEVEQKLKEYKLIPDAREKILMYLLNEDFLNETRFAQSFARGKFNFKKWGRLRITKELKARNISEYNIKKGLQEIKDSEYLSAFELHSQKKWESLINEPPAKAKQKFIAYFQYRGWENQLIFDALEELKQIASLLDVRIQTAQLLLIYSPLERGQGCVLWVLRYLIVALRQAQGDTWNVECQKIIFFQLHN